MARTALKNTASWPFQISQVKRIFIKRQKTTGNVIVRGEGSYRMDIGVYKSLIQLKKKKEFSGILFNAEKPIFYLLQNSMTYISLGIQRSNLMNQNLIANKF